MGENISSRKFFVRLWLLSQPGAHQLHVLKFSKVSKRFSSSLMTDDVTAFRTTAELVSFRTEVPNGWIIILNGTTKLGLLTARPEAEARF